MKNLSNTEAELKKGVAYKKSVQLIKNNVLYYKQFGFQKSHSTDDAVVQLVDQITLSFENNKYTPGVLIDLSTAFDTADKARNHRQIKSYLSNRRQFIQINKNEKTSLETISCGVAQGSVLGPLLILLYVNDLKNASNILDPKMFADDTNLLFTHQDIRYLFQIVNQWFISNKLSLNIYIKKNTHFSINPVKKKTFQFFYQN